MRIALSTQQDEEEGGIESCGRKQQSLGQEVLSKRVKRKGTWNRKRTAKSLADSRKGNQLTIAQMLRRPKKRRKKENSVGESS